MKKYFTYKELQKMNSRRLVKLWEKLDTLGGVSNPNQKVLVRIETILDERGGFARHLVGLVR